MEEIKVLDLSEAQLVEYIREYNDFTECQEDYFYTTSLREVEPYEETITVLNWREK